MKRGPNPVLALCVIETTDERDKLRQQLADLRIVAEGLAALAKAQATLLVAYRLGSSRTPGKALDAIEKHQGAPDAYAAWKEKNP